MSGNTGLVTAEAGFVSDYSFGARMARLVTVQNMLPGIFEVGDFASSQRALGANMSLDIAQGRAVITPAVVAHQGSYVVRRTSGTAYNTLSDGLYTWTAADATNPRIDLLCIEVKDTEMDASGLTGWRFRVVDGTPNASATHQLATTYWPAVPTGCVPIAAIRVPALATTLTTANITNLNPIGGGRNPYSHTTSPETTTSATYARLATPDFVCVYLPHADCRIQLFCEGWWKAAASSGTQSTALFINDVQLKYRNSVSGAPAAGGFEFAVLGTNMARYQTRQTDTGIAATLQFFTTGAGSASDVSDVTTGIAGGASSAANGVLEIGQLAAGWYVIEQRWKTTAPTITADERRMSAVVLG